MAAVTSGRPVSRLGDYPDVVAVAASNVTLNNDLGEGSKVASRLVVEADTGWSDPPAGVSATAYGGSGGGYTDGIFPTPSYQQG